MARPIRILDVGGTQQFWERIDFQNEDAQVVILNLEKVTVNKPNFSSVSGDARDMKRFADNEFDVVFSNSVIEHVGDYDDQRRMADEVRRVAKSYFLQTPNRFFPIEPHFLFPFFQFLPMSWQVWLVRNFRMGWYEKIKDKDEARRLVSSIRLLRKRELEDLFPDATIWEERLSIMTKSFVVYGGWAGENLPRGEETPAHR